MICPQCSSPWCGFACRFSGIQHRKINAAHSPSNGDGAINAGSGTGADLKSSLPPSACAAPFYFLSAECWSEKQ